MNGKIKKDNRKNFPKFLLMLLGSMLIGGLIGFFSGMTSSSNLPETITKAIQDFLTASLPWLFAILSAGFLIPCFFWVHKAKALACSWDGEDEELPDQVDQILNRCMLLLTILTPLALFSLPASVKLLKGPLCLVVVCEFLFVFALSIFAQKAIVDLTRTLNPEKNGSIFDSHFQKAWISSCDENERRQIGEAAFSAFNATNKVCMGLWLLLVVGGVIFNAGLLASFIVLLVWGVLQVSYVVSCIKQSRRK